MTNPSQTRSGAARRSRRARRLTGAAATVLLVVGVATTSEAVTRVTVTNPGGLTAVGPVNTDHGFPAWYGDSAGTRVEPCLDGDDPLCGFLPGDIPDPDVPVAFPDNFPGEFFYQLVDSSLTLPGGGSATLTLGLEAAFANDDPIAGDQLTFARTRIVVKGAQRSTTVTFKHPFGEATVDTDATGAGRLVQDISPAVGNFSTALKSNFGPFLRWDPAVAPAAPAGYLGDPAQTHTVVGGRNGVNQFGAFATDGSRIASTDQFSVSGKLATNTGVTADLAQVHGGFLDVFATSTGAQLEVAGVDGQYARTPMTNDAGSSRHYARIALAAGAKPASVTVRNIADKPVSTSVVKLADVTVTRADYDGTTLTVAADGDDASYPLTVVGIGSLPSKAPVEFGVTAPPATVSVRSSTGSPVTFPVTVTGGAVTPPGLPPVPPAPDPGPQDDNTGNNPAPSAPVVAVAAPTPTLPGGTVTLDASGTTGATSYAWTTVSAPTGASLAGATTSKPTLTLPFATTTAATAPAQPWAPVVLKVVATNAAGSSETQVTVPVKQDVVTVLAGARHRLGTELRIDGTSLVDGQAGVRTPATTVVVWDTTNPAAPVKLGTAPVDTLGAWPLRQKPGPTRQVTSVLVQSTRGGSTTATVGR
ncbi:hypothetical protein [Microlunatus flavus]|uniref:hypothetical protein n=1 Tax=Microlunatus flavus TaxID=1036181 RepID=UPI000B82BE2C|nr:hypothetical protein [Microlunatus flavus]